VRGQEQYVVACGADRRGLGSLLMAEIRVLMSDEERAHGLTNQCHKDVRNWFICGDRQTEIAVPHDNGNDRPRHVMQAIEPFSYMHGDVPIIAGKALEALAAMFLKVLLSNLTRSVQESLSLSARLHHEQETTSASTD